MYQCGGGSYPKTRYLQMPFVEKSLFLEDKLQNFLARGMPVQKQKYNGWRPMTLSLRAPKTINAEKGPGMHANCDVTLGRKPPQNHPSESMVLRDMLQDGGECLRRHIPQSRQSAQATPLRLLGAGLGHVLERCCRRRSRAKAEQPGRDATHTALNLRQRVCRQRWAPLHCQPKQPQRHVAAARERVTSL